jgi:hypothetical protein
VATSSELNPYKKELDDMLHDLNVLEQISELSTKLRLRYEVKFTVFFIRELSKNVIVLRSLLCFQA